MRSALVILASLLAVPATASAQDACTKRANGLAKALRAVPTHVQLMRSKLDVRLPRAKAQGTVNRIGPTLDIKDGRYVFGRAQAALEDLDPLGTELEGLARSESLINAPKGPAFVRLDRDQPVQPVLPLLCKVVDKRETHLLVDDPSRKSTIYTPPPPPARLAKVLEQVDALSTPVQKAAAFGELLQQAIGKCEAVQKNFETLGKIAPEDRAKRMADVVADGLKACKCVDADVPVMQALLLRIVAPADPPEHGRRLQLSCGGAKAKRLRLPKGATGQALLEALAKTRGPVRISVGR